MIRLRKVSVSLLWRMVASKACSSPIAWKLSCFRDQDPSSSRCRLHGKRLDFRISICEISSRMIRSFRCKDTERLADGYRVRRFVAIERVAQRKLAQLDAAATLDFLRVPPGNRLEALRGDRRGTYSIRINDQWRLCFRFEDGDAWDAEIVDYH